MTDDIKINRKFFRAPVIKFCSRNLFNFKQCTHCAVINAYIHRFASLIDNLIKNEHKVNPSHYL